MKSLTPQNIIKGYPFCRELIEISQRDHLLDGSSCCLAYFASMDQVALWRCEQSYQIEVSGCQDLPKSIEDTSRSCWSHFAILRELIEVGLP